MLAWHCWPWLCRSGNAGNAGLAVQALAKLAQQCWPGNAGRAMLACASWKCCPGHAWIGWGVHRGGRVEGVLGGLGWGGVLLWAVRLVIRLNNARFGGSGELGRAEPPHGLNWSFVNNARFGGSRRFELSLSLIMPGSAALGPPHDLK